MDNINYLELYKQYDKDIIEKYKKENKKEFLSVFLKKNDNEFKKYSNIDLSSKELLKDKSIYLYDTTKEGDYNLIGIIYRDFFNDKELENKILQNLFIELSENQKLERGDHMTELNFSKLNKHFKPLITKINDYFKLHFYIEKKDNKLFTSDFITIKITKGKRKKLNKDKKEYNSFCSIFNMDICNRKDIYSNINIPEYDCSIPIKSNRDLLILNTRDILYSNDKMKDTIQDNLISCFCYN